MIYEILAASLVRRFHTIASHPHQTIAEHSWGVAMILLHIYPECTKEALITALTHDLGELKTGDVPAHVKWANPDLKTILEKIEDGEMARLGFGYDLAPEEEAAIRCADCLELYLFSNRMVTQGKMDCEIIARRVFDYLTHNRIKYLDPFPKAKEILYAGREEGPGIIRTVPCNRM